MSCEVHGPRGPYRVGLVIPLQGPGGLFAPSCEAVAELTVHQLNLNGGICGRRVECEIIDAGRRPGQVAAEVCTLIDRGRIHAVTGWHISAVRERVALETQARVPYVYTSLYEGGEHRPGVLCSGEVPAQQIAPALGWLRDQLNLRRWCVVGEDYVWPQMSAAATRLYCHALGLRIVGEVFVPYGRRNYRPVVDAVARSGAQATGNLFAAAAYFGSLATAGAMDLLSAYIAHHGPEAPVLNNMAESCHEGLVTLQTWYARSRSCRMADLVSARGRLGYDGPRGPMQVAAGFTSQDVYLARADSFDFEVLARLPTVSG